MTRSATQGEIGDLAVDLVEASVDSLVVVDDEGRCAFANMSARRLLKAGTDNEVNSLIEDESLHVTRRPFTSAGRTYTAMTFRELGRSERQLRRVAAFARTASRVACRVPLQEVLDRVAFEARDATGAMACSIILFEPGAFHVRMVGTAGHDADYADQLMHWVDLGTPLAATDAFRTGRPSRRTRLRELVAGDPRYEPLAALSSARGWDDVVAVPASVQGQCVGVLTSFFGADEVPTDDDITFLAALADQTAVAVDNADLVAELQAAAAAAERYELAIDLHDSVLQALFSVIMQSRALAMRARQTTTGGDPELLQAVSRLEATAEEMQREIRDVLRQMQPEDAHPECLTEQLTILTEQLARAAPPKLRLELHDGDLPSLDPAVRRELFRVIREAVTNSVQHSKASEITVHVDATSTGLTVSIVDDGVGLTHSQPVSGHLGLESMTHRTARIGGSLRIESLSPGTAVHVHLPLATSHGR